MQRIALFIFVLAAIVIAAKGDNIRAATNFETDEQTKACVSEAETTIEELEIATQKLEEINFNEEIDEETKESIRKYARFGACFLTKKNMMKDSKLVLDKILEFFENKPEKVSKEVITECVNALNESDKLAPEEMVLGLKMCIIREKIISNR
ncbi:uncharacterized protein [Anoplolepis gracilipes]|uniref:uncharacterized protein n=1 Tax=Anoplolepis gracilipes TaxID=354296 RepID=UPI003BA03E92